MQIVIDIPEDRYDEIHSLKFVMYGLQSEENKQLFYRLINAVQDGTVLPDNATNGDVFNAIYADISRMGTILMDDIENIIATNVNIGWWNSPYQKGGSE